MPPCYLRRGTVGQAWAPPLNADVGTSAMLIVLQLFPDIFSSWQGLELFPNVQMGIKQVAGARLPEGSRRELGALE